MDKRQLRRWMTEKRNALSTEACKQLSVQIAERLCQLSVYRESEHICIYMAFRNEVSCADIETRARADGKHIYTPVTNPASGTMEFVEIDSNTVWRPGAYGIQEPRFTEDCNRLNNPALVLMPGLLFDKAFHRIGYGGGYYDKYLSDHPAHIPVALCYDFQIIADGLSSVAEPHDIQPDYIVTEQHIYRNKGGIRHDA